MKKQRDYEKEIVRFCQILTQQKYDDKDDKFIKYLISENLKNVVIDLIDLKKNSRKAKITKILNISSMLINMKYGTTEDIKTKEDLSFALKDLSKYMEQNRENREAARIKKELDKMTSCF